MQIIQSAIQLQQVMADARAEGKSIGFVPTMGVLHSGHISLVELAREQADLVVVSIFVNPLQFGANEDFDKYPRTLQTDAEQLSNEGVDILFAPTVADVYPDGDQITQHAGPVGSTFEGAVRPGHFDGMLTVVARLFDLVEPDFAFFGNKDAQQLFLIRRMVANSNHRWNAMKIIGAPIIREVDGLALSSRNRYLSKEQRAVADRLFTALERAAKSSGSATERIKVATTVITAEPQIRLDYVALVNPSSFEPIDDSYRGEALLLIAAKLGDTRLLDNLSITI